MFILLNLRQDVLVFELALAGFNSDLATRHISFDLLAPVTDVADVSPGDDGVTNLGE